MALGRSGIKADKREGDGATPRGRFRLLTVLWRPDRGPRPQSLIPSRPIRGNDGWCDDPTDRRYNRPVRLPCSASHERLWREDGRYDLVVVLDHNIRPRRRWAGSAIFIHIARPGLLPTEGCVALPTAELRRLLRRLDRGSRIEIG